MSFIASIAFERSSAPEKFRWTKIGAIWWDADKHHASIKLDGFRQGTCMAKPYDQNGAPYLSGDICLATGEYEKEGTMKKSYLRCGHIQTSDEKEGTVYIIEFYCMPIFTKDDREKGLFLPIFLDDDEKQNVKHRAPNAPANNVGDDDDNLPF